MQISPNAIRPEDPEYNKWNDRGFNQLFKGRPDFIVPVNTIEELTAALQQAVSANQHVVVRGGGHCLENFVVNPEVKVIIDISGMKGVRFDASHRCFEVMAGNTVGEMHEKLFNGWGVVLPVGEHPDIGIGGHIPGGAFGWLCRRLGLAVDYLYAVELLWVDENRKVQSVIATNESNDPNRELWWAHTGGGAGNFGVATRFWFRTADAVSNDPALILPKAPGSIETFEVDWLWNDINQTNFEKLISNFCDWSYRNAGPDIDANDLFGTLFVCHKSAGKIQLKGLITEPSLADILIDDFMQTIQRGSTLTYNITRKKMSWLDFALRPFYDDLPGNKIAFKFKDAFLLKPFTEEQLKTSYAHLTSNMDLPGACLGMATYGGMVNAIDANDTACFQRKAILTASCTPVWADPKEKEKYIGWARGIYSNLFAQTGGVPIPNETTGGCMIPHPDSDLLDPTINKSGVPWYRFYYGDHYPRLQKVKAKWDPLNIFHHAMSIKP